MQSASLSIVAFASVAVMVGCNEQFSPRGPYTEKLVVYGVLSNVSDTQYVRVFRTYDPPGFNPLEVSIDQMVQGATVTVVQGASTTEYRETSTTRVDKSRYASDIVAYLAHPFRVQRGSSYELKVSTREWGSVSASVTVPDRGWVELVNTYVLRGQGADEEDFEVRAHLRSGARGFLVRFFIEYEYPTQDSWMREREEIPMQALVDHAPTVYTYPKLKRRTSVAGSAVQYGTEQLVFSRIAYARKLEDIWARHPYFRIVGALLVLTQVEPSLYTYYHLVNGFQDAYSIRQDLPDWSNISGGYGVFGAMVEDSTYIDLR